MKRMSLVMMLLLAAAALLAAGCAQQYAPQPAGTQAPTQTAQPVDTVRLTNNSQYGWILADPGGMTLYYFTKDTPGNGTSACSGACIALWPAFHAATISVSPPLSAADFGEITRADGTKQTTYRGWPLYYFKNDAAPGAANGYGYNRIWYVLGSTGVVTIAPTPTPTTIATTVPTPTPTTATPTPKPTTTSYSSGGY